MTTSPRGHGVPTRFAGAAHRSGRTARTCAITAALLFCTFDTDAATWYVDLGGAGGAFSPQFLTVEAGDSITFINNGGNHNVVADDGSFRCAHGCDADGGNGNASTDFWVATITLSTPGTVGYFCEPHGSPGAGMYGSIEVLAPAAPPPPRPAPAGGWLFDLLLGLTLATLAARRLLRVRAR